MENNKDTMSLLKLNGTSYRHMLVEMQNFKLFHKKYVIIILVQISIKCIIIWSGTVSLFLAATVYNNSGCLHQNQCTEWLGCMWVKPHHYNYVVWSEVRLKS